MIKNNYKLQYSPEEIFAQVERLGKDISVWAKSITEKTGKDVIGVPVLRGGIFFFADLVRRVSESIEIGPIRSWAYVKDENNIQIQEVKINLFDLEVKGRAVLLIDDICDSGKTLKAITKALLEKGAIDVRSAVLIKREIGTKTFDPNYVGFYYEGPEWFVGYGMEDRNRCSNLPGIYTIENAK